jgi:galactokinase
LYALLGANNLSIPERQMVKLTKLAENAIGSGCGILDQASSCTTVPKHHGVLLRFIDGGDGVLFTSQPTYMDLEKHGAQVVVIFARGVARNLAGTDYGRKASLIQQGSKKIAEIVGKDVYAVTMEDLTHHFQTLVDENEEMARAVMHVFSDNERVLQATTLLNSLESLAPFTKESEEVLRELGEILQQSAKSSMENYGVQTGVKEIPSFAPLLSTFLSCGALGARNEGGGGIPTSIALIKHQDLAQFSASVPEKLKEQFPTFVFDVVPVSIGMASRVLQME